ncbi:unnamed protein product, partial [Discosporangium mesarthrocarpum]
MASNIVRTLGRSLRETGQALDRAGLQALDSTIMMEPFSRHRKIMPLGDDKPTVAADAWVAPSAALVGKVDVGSTASVWYGAVIRG